MGTSLSYGGRWLKNTDFFTGVQWPLLCIIIITSHSKNTIILLIITPLTPHQLGPFPLIVPPHFPILLIKYNKLIPSLLPLLLLLISHKFIFLLLLCVFTLPFLQFSLGICPFCCDGKEVVWWGGS